MAKGKVERWQNRIVGYGEADPESLLANEYNFRIHPKFQRWVIVQIRPFRTARRRAMSFSTPSRVQVLQVSLVRSWAGRRG